MYFDIMGFRRSGSLGWHGALLIMELTVKLSDFFLIFFYFFLNLVENLAAIFILILWGPGAVDRRAGAGRCCWSSGTVVAWSRGAQSGARLRHTPVAAGSPASAHQWPNQGRKTAAESCDNQWHVELEWDLNCEASERDGCQRPPWSLRLLAGSLFPNTFFQDRGAYWMICMAWNVKGKRSERKDSGMQDVVWVS